MTGVVFDQFAGLVCAVLQVPAAVITLVETDQQVFAGAVGLPEPWQTRRHTPLTHSFCQLVTAAGEPLVVSDARRDPRVADSLAITDLQVIGYAGMPVRDTGGQVLGVLAAIDSSPHEWTAPELQMLAQIAAVCSDSLQQQLATHSAQTGQAVAEIRKQAADEVAQRSRLLLEASVALAETSTVADVVDKVRSLVTGTLNPAYVGVSLLNTGGRIELRSGEALPAGIAERWHDYASDRLTPTALATTTGMPVLLPDLATVSALTPDAALTFAEMGWQSAASSPLPGASGPIGALTFVWQQPYTLDAAEQAVLAALAGYVAQALVRARYLSSREQVAMMLQQALLTDLPDTRPLEVAARYKPAVQTEQVGGDWYDVVRLDAELALVIGDVTGHDMHAATQMGQLRSMLRSLIADRHEPPSALLRRLDAATLLFGDRIPATAVLAYLQPTPEGDYLLKWANAGHPSPILVHPDGTVEPLTGHDPLLGALRFAPRTSHTRVLPPESTLLLYTDGLVETRTEDIDIRKQHLRQVLSQLHQAPLPQLLDQVIDRVAGKQHEDDVAVLAVRIPPR